MAAENNTAILVFTNGREFRYVRVLESKDNLGTIQVQVPPGFKLLHKIYVTAANLLYMDVNAGSGASQIPKAVDTGFDSGFFTLNVPCASFIQLTVHQ